MTETNSNRNLVAAVSYLLGFVTGIVILLIEKHDKFVRFHAMQSILIFGGLFVVDIVIGFVLSSINGALSNLINTLISLISVVIWIVSMVKAYQGQMYKWPIVGDIAEKNVK